MRNLFIFPYTFITYCKKTCMKLCCSNAMELKNNNNDSLTSYLILHNAQIIS